jgi:hypothetical protein
MDVVIGVPHRHPPHRLLIPTLGQADLVQVLGGDVRPCPSVSILSSSLPVPGSFAAAIAKWYTGLVAGSTFATRTGADNAAANVRTSRPPATVRPGSRRGRSLSQAAISRGAVWSAAKPDSPDRPSRNR